MSKLTQIENQLKQIDPARFQRLCDTYLHQRGYERINPIGLVIAADKVTQGTPDTLIALPNGNYVFAEYTTQQLGVVAKFRADLTKCFDISKTGIPLECIEEIVLCHNVLLSSDEEHELLEFGRQHGCRVTLYGIGPLSHDLYQKFPGLARDFLDVEVDTGQIVETSEFVATYQKNTFATPLDTIFQFRETEIANVVNALDHNALVLVTGRAGVGKSRLALESCARFVQAHPEFQMRCILNRGANLFEDLQVYFTPPGYYLIFVDDANRVSGFDYILQLLHRQTSERIVKIIATVRDYATDKVRDAARNYGGSAEFELGSLTNDEIRQLASTTYGIQNGYYLERIADIAAGNPRLAMMAAQTAVDKNTLQSINDVSMLYDEYFRSIRADITNLANKDLLKAAGIITFFRHVDRSNEEMMEQIQRAFGILPNAFWEAAQQLHNLEVVEMYEDEVVRISDQVLSTYLFYLVFFKERILSFGALLEHFFVRLHYRFIDALNPVLNTFDNSALVETMRPHVRNFRMLLKQASDAEGLLALMRVFWFVDEAENLLLLRAMIADLTPQTVEWSAALFQVDRQKTASTMLEALGLFRHASLDIVCIAVELLMAYIEKRPGELPQILRLLVEDYGINHRSHYSGFSVEQIVVDTVGRRTDRGEADIYPYIFLAVASHFLQVRFHTHASRKRYEIVTYDFQLPATPELLALREQVWQRVFALFAVDKLQEKIIELLQRYCSFNRESSDGEITSHDALQLLPFIEAKLSADNYQHCLLVQDYLDLLERRQISYDATLRTLFDHKNLALTELLFHDIHQQVELGWEEYAAQKQQRIALHFADYDLDGYQQFFDQCEEIAAAQHQERDVYQLRAAINMVLTNLATQNAPLYGAVLEQYLQRSNTLVLNSWPLVLNLVAACGVQPAYDVLAKPNYQHKRTWLFNFFSVLPSAEITAERTHQLYRLYEQAEPGDFISSLDFLEQYQKVEPDIIVRVVGLLTDKAEKDSRYGVALINLVDSYHEISKRLKDIFAAQAALLQRAYLAALRSEPNADHNRSTFNQLLELNPGFMSTYMVWLHVNEDWMRRSHDTHDYSFIWRRTDYAAVMDQALITIHELKQHGQMVANSPLKAFFTRREGKIDEQIEARQDQWFSEGIVQHCSNIALVRLLFGVISELAPERRRPFIGLYVQHNTSFDDFQKLPLEPSSWSWTGSMVPMLQRRVEFLESLRPFFASIELLEHRYDVEQRIRRLYKEIEAEKRRDFMQD